MRKAVDYLIQEQSCKDAGIMKSAAVRGSVTAVDAPPQQPDWPKFTWDAAKLARAEKLFQQGAGVLIRGAQHLTVEARDELTLVALGEEAVTTSAIKGEVLNRASVQSSLQRQLGFTTDKHKVAPTEQGISEVMVDLYRGIFAPLTQDVLFRWHEMMMAGRRDLTEVGRYRTSEEPMQVISGAPYASRVHFEAPPSSQVSVEMDRFLNCFNQTGPDGVEPLSPLARAGIAHLYFESIHPFEDGNGRVGRAIAEKALVQGFEQRVLIALATAILARQGDYYKALEAANKLNEITNWLLWFAGIAMQAQARTKAQVRFLLEKTKLLDRVRGTHSTIGR